MHIIYPRLTQYSGMCGLDEAGRGALAGPLVAAAVLLANPGDDFRVLGKIKINDSKLLTPKQRCLVIQTLLTLKPVLRYSYISPRLINRYGISWANREAFRRLIRRINAREYIVDGNMKIGSFQGVVRNIKSVVHADASILPVMLAGIAAKVERDKIMQILHVEYPNYGWQNNSGYGTPQHILALKNWGENKHHRKLFTATAIRNSIITT